MAEILRRSTGLPLPVGGLSTHQAGISVTLSGAPPRVGDQGDRLDVDATGITIRPNGALGLFAGVQTLRQLLPAAAESTYQVPARQLVAGGQIVDKPRFA